MCDLRIGSLFSGCGGLDLGVRSAIGGHVAWHAEHYRPARAVLRAHYPATPLYDDIAAVDWHGAPRVDVVTAGFPCQKLSLLGRREGLRPGDAHQLFDQPSGWDLTMRVVDAVEPAAIVLENVSALLTARVTDGAEPGTAFGAILRDLAARGFDAEWTCADASNIGAAHRRRRLFALATHPERIRLGPWRNRSTTCQPPELRGHDPHRSDRRRTRPTEPVQLGRYMPALDRWADTIGRPAPHPVLNRARNPRFWEWLMGLPEGWLDPAGMPAALRVAGNSVVPQQAAAAILELAR